MARRYGQWAGNPKGSPENPNDCIVQVWLPRAVIPFQCSKKRGKGPDGLYCGTHARMIEQGRYVNVPKDEEATNAE